MISSRQHDIPLVAIRRPRTIAGVLRRLASQGDHDLAVDDLDVIGTGLSGGLERGRERRLSLPAFRRRGVRADDEVTRV
jgi:hypothetical protein